MKIDGLDKAKLKGEENWTSRIKMEPQGALAKLKRGQYDVKWWVIYE